MWCNLVEVPILNRNLSYGPVLLGCDATSLANCLDSMVSSVRVRCPSTVPGTGV
jgi:hypothetical protein